MIGYGLKLAWDAGHWYLTFLLIIGAYWTAWHYSTDEERETFKNDVKRLIRWRGK